MKVDTQRPGKGIIRPRVLPTYRVSAFLSFLSDLSKHGMSNLRGLSGLDGSIPTAPTNLLSFPGVRLPPLFQLEHLFQLTASRCAP